MAMNDAIRVFLESPRSLEPAGADDQKRRRGAAKACTQRRRRRREALPPYVARRSIYEEADFSKLTERQKLMVLRYRANCGSVNSLFKAMNGICQEQPRGECDAAREDGAGHDNSTANTSNIKYGDAKQERILKSEIKIRKLKLKESTVGTQHMIKESIEAIENAGSNECTAINNSDVLDETTESKEMIDEGDSGSAGGCPQKTAAEDDASKEHGNSAAKQQETSEESALFDGMGTEDPEPKQPPAMAVTCSGCKADICDLLQFLAWATEQHRSCEHSRRISRLRQRLAHLTGTASCVCDAERAFFEEAAAVGQLCCCLDKHELQLG